MSGWDIFWIAVGYLLAALIGAFLGGFAIIKVLFKMHENSVRPKD